MRLNEVNCYQSPQSVIHQRRCKLTSMVFRSVFGMFAPGDKKLLIHHLMGCGCLTIKHNDWCAVQHCNNEHSIQLFGAPQLLTLYLFLDALESAANFSFSFNQIMHVLNSPLRVPTYNFNESFLCNSLLNYSHEPPTKLN